MPPGRSRSARSTDSRGRLSRLSTTLAAAVPDRFLLAFDSPAGSLLDALMPRRVQGWSEMRWKPAVFIAQCVIAVESCSRSVSPEGEGRGVSSAGWVLWM